MDQVTIQIPNWFAIVLTSLLAFNILTDLVSIILKTKIKTIDLKIANIVEKVQHRGE